MRIKIIFIIVVVAVFSGCIELEENTEIITSQSDFRYETGIRITEKGQKIKNRVFVDIPIGIAVWKPGTTIDNCTFINCSDEGIVFFNMSHNNTVRNCVFYQCVDGIEMQSSSNNTFYNCVFIENSHAAIDAIHGSNNNNTFHNCVFYENYMGIYSYDSYGNMFVECTFHGNTIDHHQRRI
jgi:parallel beta-helix repeat protein